MDRLQSCIILGANFPMWTEFETQFVTAVSIPLWQMDGASKEELIWICDWWNLRSEVNLLPDIWPCSKCRSEWSFPVAVHTVMTKGRGVCERKSCCTCTELTTQLEHHICGDSGCFIIWMNSFQTSLNHLVRWTQFDAVRSSHGTAAFQSEPWCNTVHFCSHRHHTNLFRLWCNV